DVPGDVDPALGLLVECLQRFGVNGVDGDALPRRENANDAIARNRAALGELDRKIAAQSSDGDAARSVLAAARAGAGPAEFEAHHLAEPKPSFVVALDLAPALGSLLRLFLGE